MEARSALTTCGTKAAASFDRTATAAETHVHPRGVARAVHAALGNREPRPPSPATRPPQPAARLTERALLLRRGEMLARVRSGALMGVDAVVVDVEVDMAMGLPYFNVVGLPEGAVKESKVRVISALKNCDFELPSKRVTVNLAPADIRK